MTKSELIQEVWKYSDLPLDKVKETVDVLINVISRKLICGEKVQIVGFGTFSVRERAEHKVRNPRTGERITIPAHKVPRFKFGKILKDALIF